MIKYKDKTIEPIMKPMLCWDNDEDNAQELFVLATVTPCAYPVCVVGAGQLGGWGCFKRCKPIPEPTIVELTLEDISNGKGVGIPSHLIRIKE